VTFDGRKCVHIPSLYQMDEILLPTVKLHNHIRLIFYVQRTLLLYNKPGDIDCYRCLLMLKVRHIVHQEYDYHAQDEQMQLQFHLRTPIAPLTILYNQK